MMDTLYFQQGPELGHVPDQILVKVRQGYLAQFMNRISMIGLRILKSMKLLAGDFVVVKTSPQPLYGVLTLLADLPEVEYAEPNYIAKKSAQKAYTPKNVNDISHPWEKFSAKEAAIDVIDSKIDLKLPRVESEIKVNSQKIGYSGNNNFVEVNIKDLLFLSDALPMDLAEAVEVLDYATKMEVDVVSNSWVRDGFSKALNDTIKVAEKKGVSFIASAFTESLLETPQSDSKTSSNVSAGVLSLYIAQEAKDGRTGRGRLIAKAVPSADQIRNEWRSGALGEFELRLHQQDDVRVTQNYSFPGAKFIKLEIAKLNQSTNLQLIKVRTSTGILIPNISRHSDLYEIDYIQTDLIVIEFHSNAASTSIGAVIRNVRVIY